MTHDEQEKNRFSIDPASVAASRAELREIVRGNPMAEAAVAGMSNWQAIEAMERLLAVAAPDTKSSVVSAPPSNRASQSASSDSGSGVSNRGRRFA